MLNLEYFHFNLDSMFCLVIIIDGGIILKFIHFVIISS